MAEADNSKKIAYTRLVGEVSYPSVKEVMTVCDSVRQDPSFGLIRFFLSTPGGEVMAAHSLFEHLVSVRIEKPVEIVAEGVCMSMGTYIMQSASEGMRVARPKTQIMIHENSTSLSKVEVISALELRLRSIQQLSRVGYESIAHRLGITVEEYESILRGEHSEAFMTAEKAKSLNLIDIIRENDLIETNRVG